MRLIGEWYRDNVLNQTDLVEVELPHGPGEIRIERQLFSYFLYHGKKSIELETEEEARYLQAFLQAGQSNIRMPRDREYLKKILPDLEQLMSRTLEIIDDRLCGILNETKKQKILDLFWYKAMREGYEAEDRLFPPQASDDEDEEMDDEEKDTEVESQE